MAELMLGQPLFPGESGIDQLVEIIKVLGTPTRDQIRTMNPNYMEHKFPQIKPHPFSKVCDHLPLSPIRADVALTQVFRKADPQAIDLISKLLEYTPTQRLSAIDAMVHPFFDELRDPSIRLPDSRHPNGATRDMPELYTFTHHGMKSLQSQPMSVINTSRTFHSTSPESAAGASAYSPSIGRPRAGLRIAELQAVNEGPDDGEARLSLARIYAKRYHLLMRHGFWSSPFMSTKLSVREMQNGVSLGVGVLGVYATSVHLFLLF